MPQEFRVVKCFNCNFYQVDIVKKSTKWCCKLCGEKQSLIKVFVAGESSKDCRAFVQKLNEKQIKADANCRNVPVISKNEYETNSEVSPPPIQSNTNQVPVESKWTDLISSDHNQQSSQPPSSPKTFKGFDTDTQYNDLIFEI